MNSSITCQAAYVLEEKLFRIKVTANTSLSNLRTSFISQQADFNSDSLQFVCIILNNSLLAWQVTNKLVMHNLRAIINKN